MFFCLEQIYWKDFQSSSNYDLRPKPGIRACGFRRGIESWSVFCTLVVFIPVVMDYPKLRPVNIFPVQMSGKYVICLQDPLNISEKSLFLPPALYFIVSHFDGQHSALDIQTEYMRKFGGLLFSEKIQEIIGQLEENLFLEGDRFRRR